MDGALKNTEKKVKSNIYCLNCGSKLRGDYCHKCGQKAADTNLNVWGFVMEYLYNAFMWDPKFLKTLWLLVSKPGVLTKEFLAGKYVSQVHPLKLNMFMLFIFVTIFVFFSGAEKVNNSVISITDDERVTSIAQIELMIDNEELLNRLKTSERDTVQLIAPLLLAENHPDIITKIRVIEDTKGESLDKWVAVIPRMLIEDNILLPHADGYYSFKNKVEEVELVKTIWAQMVKVTTRHFPLIVLLTAPFLSFSLRLVQYRKKLTGINRFIFSLHYIAFLELSIILIYLLHLIAKPSVEILQWILLASSGAYLTAAFHRVYNANSWVKAAFKALYTILVYLTIILFVFMCICFFAIIVVAAKQ
jgi:hypothetical protein